MAAPDVDVDVARTQVAAMRPNFILFVSREDRALALSRRLWGKVRLGAIDPEQEPLKSELRRERIEVVNPARKWRFLKPAACPLRRRFCVWRVGG
jgi:esterase/lipase superfamily enzyme